MLEQYASLYGISLSAEQLDQFGRYQTLLIEWNERMNLTRIIEPHDIVVRHFIDSLTCSLVMGDLAGQRVIDVGTGAGFPGLPLKILQPDMLLTLTDSVAKKTRFLEAVVAELGLTRVRVIHERVETLGQQPNHRGRYDWAVARAVARLPALTEYLLPLVRVGGNMLAQKGETAMDEVESAAHAIDLLGGANPEIVSIELPGRDTPHYLVTIDKIKKTPKAYPRQSGTPSKSPLGMQTK